MCISKYLDEQLIAQSYLQKINPPEEAVWLKKRDFAIKGAGDESVIAGWQLPVRKGEAVAGGKKKTNGAGYCYAEYANSAAYFGSILMQPVGERYGYECIRPGQPCKLYFDIEWLGPYDPTRGKLLSYVREIRRYLRLAYGGEYALYITCGSRQLDNGMFKNSYHIVVGGLIFSNNHEGAMKSCVAAIKKNVDDSSEGIDMKVYSWGQMMRTILCSKRGSSIPLRSITGDPFNSSSSLFSEDVCVEDIIAELGNYLVTAQDDRPDVKRVDGFSTVNISKSAASQNQRRKRERAIRSVDCDVLGSSESFMPWNVTADYQRMLDATRSKGCVVTGRVHKINECYILQCGNSGTRTCIANSVGRLHTNENARLVVSNGYIQYRCYSESCKHSHFVVGAIPESFRAFIAPHAEETSMCVDIDGVARDPVVEEGTHEDMVFEDDSSAFPLHQQLLPFPHPTDANQERMKSISDKYLGKSLYACDERIVVIESSCKTGKTTSMVQYILENDLRIISVCTHIAQVQSQSEIMEANGMPVILYTDANALKNAIVGQKNIVTTINSACYALSSVINDNRWNASQYVVVLDEFHSIVSAVYGSETLDHQRKEILSCLQFLVTHCKKVIVMDNFISNADIFFIDTLMSDTSEKAPLVFYENTYKAFDGIPFSVCYDQAKIFEQMKDDVKSGLGFIASFNTKSGARIAFRELQDAIDDPVLKAGMRYYDGDTDKNINIARECLEEWNGFGVIHNTKITTALDYHPTSPINSYNFTNGISTACPATTIQMILRNRNIKQVYFCPSNMPDTAQFANKEAFFANLNFVYPQSKEAASTSCAKSHKHSPALSVLREINNTSWSSALGKYVYSENKFSLGYQEWLWERYLMNTSYVCNTVTLARKRGFVVPLTCEFDRVCIPTHDKICNLKKQCLQDDEEALLLWKKDKETPRTDFFNRRLLAVSSIYRGLKLQTDASMLLTEKKRFCKGTPFREPTLNEYVHRVFTRDRVFETNQNMVLCIYTVSKLQSIASQQQISNYEVKCMYNTVNTAILYRELIAVWNKDMPLCSSLKPYDLTIRQRDYTEDDVLDIPDHVWDQYKRRLDGVSDRPTTRKTVLECIFLLSRGLFGSNYAIRSPTNRRFCGVGIRCYNYSCDQLALRAFVHLVNWTKCNLEDFEPAVVAAYKLVKKHQKKAVTRTTSCKDTHKIKLSKLKQDKRISRTKKRKNVGVCDETLNKRHKASDITMEETHAVFFEGVHEIRKQNERELNEQNKRSLAIQKERMSGKRIVVAPPVKTTFSVAYSVEELQCERTRQCIQVRMVDAFVIKNQYRNSPVLKAGMKRALAQRAYSYKLSLAPEELDAMYDALEFTNEFLQTTRCGGN